MMQIIVVLIYFGVILGISARISRKNNGISDFLVGKHELGILSIIPMLFSELIAGSATVGNAATAYSLGISAIWYTVGLAIGCILTVVFVSKFYRVMASQGKMSVGESLAEYFDQRTGVVMALITAIVYVIIFSLQPAAAASIIAPMLGISETLCLWIVGIVFILIAMLGGIKGLAKINFLHSLVMYFGIGISALLTLRYVGGHEALIANLPSSHFDLMRPGVFTVIAWVAGASINLPAGSMIAGVILSGKNLRTSRLSLILVAILLIPFAILVAIIGLSARASGLIVSNNNVIYIMTTAVHPIAAGISSMAILAAILSTAPVLLMMVGGTLTRDIYKRFIHKDANDSQQLRCSKFSILIIGIFGIFMGMMDGALLERLLGALQIRSVAGLVLMVAMTWKRVNNIAAFWSILVGGAIASIWFFAGNPFGVEPLWPSLAVSTIILIALTISAKEKVYPGYRSYKKAELAIDSEL